MKPLDAILGEFVTPVLRAGGFRKTRRTYRLAAPNGSQSLVYFENYILSMSQTTFFVNVGVTVEAFRAWIHHRVTPSIPYRPQPSIGDRILAGSAVATQGCGVPSRRVQVTDLVLPRC
jgi:Domain of unknown function (DUF4304)